MVGRKTRLIVSGYLHNHTVLPFTPISVSRYARVTHKSLDIELCLRHPDTLKFQAAEQSTPIMADIEKQQPVRLSSNSTGSSQNFNRKVSDSVNSASVQHPGMKPNAAIETSHSRTYGDVIDVNDPGETQVAGIRQGSEILSALRRAETWLDRKLHFEAMGVQRVPEDKRQPPQILNVRLSLVTRVGSVCSACHVLRNGTLDNDNHLLFFRGCVIFHEAQALM